MPPKTSRTAIGPGRTTGQQRGGTSSYARDTMNWVANPENRTVVTAVGFFAAGVAFLHSSWSEILLPPL
ncbi:unnamed protein product [Zymoseptoria tritici ST99CH_1A5]|uniref:TOM core complex subunit Tom6 n=3 Tax=Zymoseptoria tritici TaxID=1047171 RepID=A0A1X7RI32_ZYMT9|nr:unnamed protein product [Zymoseptoria tritici ST99CH_3D7]SMR45599.1 unnamed protein product [Zymoseptoria tritici ST99CH_1E4]SMR46873.1 unnamed protein product [Zymoseptoria tritici ST99CH_3D1]SMY20766.1 unnamed protein product [Zymoseptoria tritici ST99CH_1A5]